MEKDKIFCPNEKYELPLYGNQWIPLGVKTTLEEKCKLSAILDKACNGGSIAHINIDAPFTNFDTAWDMLNYVADSGVPFDPLARPDPDVTLSSKERKIGGLGIYMMKQTMDDVSYEYSNGENVLTMKKII